MGGDALNENAMDSFDKAAIYHELRVGRDTSRSSYMPSRTHAQTFQLRCVVYVYWTRIANNSANKLTCKCRHKDITNKYLVAEHKYIHTS